MIFSNPADLRSDLMKTPRVSLVCIIISLGDSIWWINVGRDGKQRQFATRATIPGNRRSLKFPAGIPGNFEDFQNCHFFLDSDGSILRKTSLFRSTFWRKALNSEQLSHILFCGTIEWLIRTRSKLNSSASLSIWLTEIQACKSRYSHYGTVTNYHTI